MGFIENIPEEAFISTWGASTTKKVNTPSKTIGSVKISNEEQAEKTYKKKDLVDWLWKRSETREKIWQWKVTTWNKWADNWEIRKWRLADVARWALLDMWKEPDKLMKISDDDIIKRITSDNKWTNQTKLDTVNKYIQFGGNAEETFKSLTSGKEKKEKLWFTENAIGNAASVPVKSVLNISNMLEDWVRNIFWLKDRETARQEKLEEQYKDITTEWYNEWKKNWGRKRDAKATSFKDIFDSSRFDPVSDRYEAYEKAVKDWFEWTIEDYKNYVIYWWDKATNLTDYANKYMNREDVWETFADTTLIWKPMTLLKHDEKWPWSTVGKFAWESMELLFTPELKAKWLKNTKVWQKLTKVPWANLTKNALQLATEWAEFQLIDDVYNGKISDADAYKTAMWSNMALWGLIRWTTRLVSSLPAKSQAAIWSKTEAEWNAMSKITDDYFNKAGNKVTPYSEIINTLRSAKDALKKKRVKVWWELETAEKALQYWDNAYTAINVAKDFENAFAKLWEWPNAKLPKFNVSPIKNELKITNKWTLNKITRNENWVTIKLWDEIENAWDETFNMFDKKVTPQTTNEFIKKVEAILWNSWWTSTSWKWVRTMREALKWVKENFEKSLTKDSAANWKTAKDTASKSINIDNDFDDIVWQLETVSWMKKATNLQQYGNPNTEELFRLVKDEVWIDLNNEIWAWIVNIALRNPAEAEKLIKTFYPSWPWATEFVMKWIIWKLQKWWAAKYTIDWGMSSTERLTEAVPSRILTNIINQ